MISPAEVHGLHARTSEELREIAAHIAGILAQRDGCDEVAAMYLRVSERLTSMGLAEKRAAA
jgi:hypothetical protein